MAEPGEMAREMERVCRALAGADQLLAGLDQAASALELASEVAYSPLRTLVDHAAQSAALVLSHLRAQS